jgi:hypothetical protein
MNSNDESTTLTVGEFERILAAQGCNFPTPERDRNTGEMVLVVGRWDESDRRRVSLYVGAQDDRVSRDFLFKACSDLKLEPSLFGLA